MSDTVHPLMVLVPSPTPSRQDLLVMAIVGKCWSGWRTMLLQDTDAPRRQLHGVVRRQQARQLPQHLRGSGSDTWLITSCISIERFLGSSAVCLRGGGNALSEQIP